MRRDPLSPLNPHDWIDGQRAAGNARGDVFQAILDAAAMRRDSRRDSRQDRAGKVFERRRLSGLISGTNPGTN